MSRSSNVSKFRRAAKRKRREFHPSLTARIGAIALAGVALVLVGTEFLPEFFSSSESSGTTATATPGTSAIEKCRSGQPNTPDKTCVVDGDTLWLDGVNIRLEAYDTPEPYTGLCGGEAERALANRASDRLVELLNANAWTLELAGEQGGFGREIGTIRINGRDVGDILIEEGLARSWPDGEEFWCD